MIGDDHIPTSLLRLPHLEPGAPGGSNDAPGDGVAAVQCGNTDVYDDANGTPPPSPHAEDEAEDEDEDKSESESEDGAYARDVDDFVHVSGSIRLPPSAVSGSFIPTTPPPRLSSRSARRPSASQEGTGQT